MSEKTAPEKPEFFNRNASVSLNGKEYRFDEDDFSMLNTSSNYWHHKTDPSTWLCEAIVRLGRKNFGVELGREMTISLCAATLNISAEKLEKALEWNAGYMAWHDGGEAGYHHVWPKEESQ